MGKWFVVFTLIPVVELWLLMRLAAAMGLWSTVALVIVTGALGAAMARAEGLRVLRGFQSSMASGQLPEEGVVSALLVLVGGVLLVTPGVLTDAFGLLLLMPPFRRMVTAAMESAIARGMSSGRVHVVQTHGRSDYGPPSSAGGRRDRTVIEVESRVIDSRRA